MGGGHRCHQPGSGEEERRIREDQVDARERGPPDGVQ